MTSQEYKLKSRHTPGLVFPETVQRRHKTRPPEDEHLPQEYKLKSRHTPGLVFPETVQRRHKTRPPEERTVMATICRNEVICQLPNFPKAV
jgi:hypothetical protein